MKQIKAEKLTREAFAPFGEYYDILNPEGYAFTGKINAFYPDRMSESYVSRAAFSPMTVKKPDKMIVENIEYHTTTPEIIIAFNDDMIVHVAPASKGIPVTDLTKAFIVPKGTLIKLKTAIWHACPMPVKEDVLNVMIVLPEAVYANDCKVVRLEASDQFEIVM